MVENLERALWSIHSLLVAGRSLAYESAPAEQLAEIFDAAEVLPLFLLEERDNTSVFRSILEGVAEKYPTAQRALDGFDGDTPISHHYCGHLAASLKRAD